MADLTFPQGSDPVSVFNDSSGNQLVINADGSINEASSIAYQADQKKVYVASFDFNLASSGEKMVLYFRNPNGSGKVVKIIDMTTGLTNTVSSEVVLRIYVNPTVTANGTTYTPLPAYVGGSQPAAVALLTTGPTVTANGSQHFAVNGNNTQSAHYDFDEALILAANNSILITGNPDGTNRNLTLSLRWAEI